MSEPRERYNPEWQNDPREEPPGWIPPETPAWSAYHVPAEPRRRRRAPMIAAAAVGVIAAVAGVTVGHAVWHTGGPSAASSPFAQGDGGLGGAGSGGSGSAGAGGGGSAGGSGAGSADISAVAQKVDPALVDIDTTLGFQSAEAAGTGIVLTSDGEILTNNHVINGATSIKVTDIGDGRTYTATVVGYDRSQDIAVLQLQNASGLATAGIDESSPSVGQAVAAIGNAGGAGGAPSVAGGTVTAVNQSITARDEAGGTAEQLSGLIGVDADVQPGDSGGSLVNASGQVIGVDTAATESFSLQSAQDGQSSGFAIPIGTALSIAQQIEAGKASSTVHIGQTAFLGVLVESAGGQGGGQGGASGFGGGAVISEVLPNGGALQAGLTAGDVITSLDGQSVSSANDLSSVVDTLKPGQSVPIGYTDTGGQQQTRTMLLGSGPPA